MQNKLINKTYNPCIQKTLFLYRKGLNIKEIAVKQGIKESTVWSHFVNLVEHKQISVWNILSREKICKILNKVYSRKDRLKDIKKRSLIYKPFWYCYYY